MRVVCLAVTLGRHVVPAHRPTPPRASGAPSAPLDSAVAARGSAPIFCNRAVNLGRIDAIGFDMDHTLAQYVSRPFDLLAYNGAKERLVDFGYPEAVRDFHYDEHRFQRGLVIDKAQGNVLKMDRHKYVKVAHHGLTEMSAEQRKAQYDTQRPAFTPPEFANIDTAFLLVDVCLYTQLVEYSDAHPGAITRSYAQMYADVRRSVDLCHCDGVIKDVVMANPAGYIERDPQLAALLLRVRASGKKVFLLTNSLWDYTEAVMKHLLAADAAKHSLTDWTDFFDVVIVGARKPAFLLDGNLPIFRVSPEDGSLANLENAAFAAGPDSVHKILAAGRVFQGGALPPAGAARPRQAARAPRPHWRRPPAAPPSPAAPCARRARRQLEPPALAPRPLGGGQAAVRGRPHVLRRAARQAHARLVRRAAWPASARRPAAR